MPRTVQVYELWYSIEKGRPEIDFEDPANSLIDWALVPDIDPDEESLARYRPFDVTVRHDDALDWAMPAINKFVIQLRKRFPDIGLAVVTHGSEQFGLMTSEQKEMPAVHTTVQSLVAEGVPVHVCGTHASWYGKDANDFPDYVDVSPAGPTEINNYEDMGYALVRVEEPE